MEFLNTVNKYISGKEYANKGIRTSDGKLAYVTSTGVTKQFSDAGAAGPNCPNEFVDVDQTWKNLGFPIGSLMINGQSCGNEGTYVRSEPPTTEFDWEFYLKNNSDLTAAGFNNEQQATNHWNNYGKAEGRAPNATIFSSMGMLGKVGYIDVDTVFHSVKPTYKNEYTAFPNRTNLTGTSMVDCSTPPEFLKFGDPIVFIQNNITGYLNSSSVLQFGTDKTNFFIRPPPGDERTGKIVKSGDTICISSSSSSYTNECGWWGCKVGKISKQNEFVFGSGGDNPQPFFIFSTTLPRGADMRMDNSFVLISIPQKNKLQIPYNSSVNCTAGSDGRASGIYRYSGANELNYYPTPDIANSWNPNWPNVINKDCSTYDFGDTITKKNVANLNMGQSVYCNVGQELPDGVNGGVYRYVDDNTLRWYPSGEIASRWDQHWQKHIPIDCSTYKAGPAMSMIMKSGTGKEIYEPYKYVYISKGIALFGSNGEANMKNAVFSFQHTTVNNNCDINKLKKICNSEDCLGFVQSPSNNSWQMITSKSSSGDYKITSNTQDIYLRDAEVNLNDESCEPGPVSFINGSLLANYPQGDAFGKGSGQCKVIQAPKYKVKSDVKKANKIVNDFPTVKYNSTETEIMKEKTNEYRGVLKGIKKMDPSVTLEQQYTDITVFDEQNKTALIIWSVISVSILGFVLFRMKS